MLDGKELREKKEREQMEIFVFDFLDCKEKLWDSGAMVYIRIARGFHL